MLAGIGAFALCGVGLTLAQRQAALLETVRDAEVTASLLAARVVQPALPLPPRQALDTDPRFDQIIRTRVLVDPITTLRIVDESGLVLYSTEADSVGQRVELSPEETDALRTSQATARHGDGAQISFLDDYLDKSLDVSAGLRTQTGQPLLVQMKQPYEAVWLTSRAVWFTVLPSLILALMLLYLVKAIFAYLLAQGLYTVQDQREQLLVTALAAADQERTMIASDLHDGVVQGLAGASYALTEAANRSRNDGQTEVAATLTDLARNLRQWVRELRSLIVTVTPPALHNEGIQAALTDLVATLEARRIDVDLDVHVGDSLNETDESLVYRVAQEGIRNVARHSDATKVHLFVTEEDGWLVLRLADDGKGFDTSASNRQEGSVGLALLAALVHQKGGAVRVESAEGDGTTMTLRLPLEASPDETRQHGSIR